METKFNGITTGINSTERKSAELGQSECNGGTNGDRGSVYYGVYISSENQNEDNVATINVFQDKVEALKLVKKNKKARFKAFNFYHEAADFAINGAEVQNNNNGQNAAETASAVGEKPSPYRGPKSQDLVMLRKVIESGNIETVTHMIWENPRYLISAGDTPSILQEGFRYNALHVAAKAKNDAMCRVILYTISDVNFIKLLYGGDNNQDAEERCKILLDLYLNTPDKGLNETPLHFASKFGADKVVEVFVSFSQCDKTLKNKYGMLASEIICDRCDETVKGLKQRIALLLEDTYYVPVLRSEDNCIPPVVGDLFSPTSPPKFNQNLLDSRLEIHAYAGPMEKDEAERFRKVWKTPPRNKSKVSYANLSKLKYKDPEKGLECVGRVLASERDVGWKEFWPFLNAFADLTSTEGLDLFENYLKHRSNMTFNWKSSVSSSSSSEQMEKCAPNLSNEISPVSDLCNAFQLCSLSDSNHKSPKTNTKVTTHLDFHYERKTDNLPDLQLLKNEISPFLYVEKTCQVFAKRISKDILYIVETDSDTTNIAILEAQIKQLASVISSFKDDNRFTSVNFQVVHSRMSSLICAKLDETINEEQNHELICITLEKYFDLCGNHYDSFSSDDESINQRQERVKAYKKPTSQKSPVACLLQGILTLLHNNVEKVIPNTEEECAKVWSKARPCSCNLQSKHLKRNSLSKRYDKSSHKSWRANELERVCKKLTYSDSNKFDSPPCNVKLTNSISDSKSDNSSSSDEEFYTPPSSPSHMEPEDSDDDVFNESLLPEIDIFIEGNSPTKTDATVYTALTSTASKLNPDDYPNIYRWFHTVSLYKESEREQWGATSKLSKCTVGTPLKLLTPNNYYSQPSPILGLSPGVHSPRGVYDNKNFYNL